MDSGYVIMSLPDGETESKCVQGYVVSTTPSKPVPHTKELETLASVGLVVLTPVPAPEVESEEIVIDSSDDSNPSGERVKDFSEEPGYVSPKPMNKKELTAYLNTLEVGTRVGLDDIREVSRLTDDHVLLPILDSYKRGGEWQEDELGKFFLIV